MNLGNAEINKLFLTEGKTYNENKAENINPTNENNALSLIVNTITKNSIVLDVGCSYGYVGEWLNKNKNCTIYGIDIDVEALKHVKSSGYYKDLFKIDKTILFETFPSLKNADLKDRFGMKQFLNNEKSNIIDFSFPENILTSLYESAGDVILPGSEIHKILIIFGKEILKIINGKINAIKIIKDNNVVIQNGELTALAVNSTIIGDAAFIKRTIGQKDADLLIVPNMTDENKTSVVKIGIRQDHIDLKKLSKLVNVSFLHANGFMAVLDRPFDYMFAEEVLNVL